jgi:AmmeMemoRadiSam system protein B
LIRKPAVAGQFYPASERKLREEIERYVDENADRTKALGAVAPHAGYVYSGETAGAVYSRLTIPETVVLLGPNHTGRGEAYSIQVEGLWRTPLGDAQVDSALAKTILEGSKYLVEDDSAHEFEHSIEVQVPFLQYLRRDIRIVPIVLSEGALDVCREIGKAIADAVSEKSPDTLIVASSDMTHYESADEAKAKDDKAIDAIVNLSEEELVSRVRKFRISMCGYIPAAVMLAACKRRGASRVELVKYTNSGEKSGDFAQVVGYAGIIVV